MTKVLKIQKQSLSQNGKADTDARINVQWFVEAEFESSNSQILYEFRVTLDTVR